MTRFDLDINYAQLSVFDADLERPYNDWTPAHVQQGFAWRPGSVSFALPDAKAAQVTVTLAASRVTPGPSAKRAVVVPIVKHDADLVVGSIMSTEHQLALPAGRYGLLFEASDDAPCSVNLTFYPSTEDEFAVLLAGKDMNPDAPIVREAEPA